MLKSTLNLVLVAASLVFSGGVFGQGPTPLLAQSAAECLAALESDAPLKAKMDACRQLATLGGPEAVPVLAKLLGDEQLSHMARYALEPNPSPTVDRVLIEALGQLEGRPLVGVIGSLGVRRYTPAVGALANLLDHRQAEVAQAAARALGQIGTVPAGRALLAAAEYAPAENLVAFCEGLARCAEVLAKSGPQEAALAIYSHYEDDALPHQVRAAALKGAILVRGKDGLTLMRQMLRHPDYILFSATISAALATEDPSVTQALVGELPTLSVDRQIVVMQTLGQRGDSAANPALFTAAQTSAKAARLTAIQAIAQIGNPAAVPVLEGLLGDPDREIREMAKESYASLPGPRVDAAVLDMLGDLDASTQLLAIDLLERRRMLGNLPALLKAATEAGDRVRPAALRAIAELGGGEQIPVLLDLLMQAKTVADRDAAEEAVRQLYARAAAPSSQAGALVDRLARATPPQRTALLRLFGAIGGESALAAVRSSLKDSDAEVRGSALRVLADWKTADAAPDLLRLARNPSSPTERILALRGYLRLAAQAEMPNEERLAMCREAESLIQRDDEKRLLLGALGAIPSLDTVPMIVPYLGNPGTQNEAGAALLAVTDQLLKADQKGAGLTVLIEPLQRIAAGNNANLAERARTALRRVEPESK